MASGWDGDRLCAILDADPGKETGPAGGVRGHLAIVEALLEKGADMQGRDQWA